VAVGISPAPVRISVMLTLCIGVEMIHLEMQAALSPSRVWRG